MGELGPFTERQTTSFKGSSGVRSASEKLSDPETDAPKAVERFYSSSDTAGTSRRYAARLGVPWNAL